LELCLERVLQVDVESKRVLLLHHVAQTLVPVGGHSLTQLDRIVKPNRLVRGQLPIDAVNVVLALTQVECGLDHAATVDSTCVDAGVVRDLLVRMLPCRRWLQHHFVEPFPRGFTPDLLVDECTPMLLDRQQLGNDLAGGLQTELLVLVP